jgi:ketosteroid isomerase-like protein
MPQSNRAILEAANAAIIQGNYEGFLAFCADDTEWTFIGEQTLKGKEAVRQWMVATYREPPEFTVTRMIADGDFVVALGDIVTKAESGKTATSSYCDVWRFHAGKIVELRAFVIAT